MHVLIAYSPIYFAVFLVSLHICVPYIHTYVHEKLDSFSENIFEK